MSIEHSAYKSQQLLLQSLQVFVPQFVLQCKQKSLMKIITKLIHYKTQNAEQSFIIRHRQPVNNPIFQISLEFYHISFRYLHSLAAIAINQNMPDADFFHPSTAHLKLSIASNPFNPTNQPMINLCNFPAHKLQNYTTKIGLQKKRRAYNNQLVIARQMTQVHINNITVGNNPAKVTDPFLFNITFECFSPLPGTLDWKLIYIGSPNNENCDQIIDTFDMDNIAPGVMEFSVESNCPDFNLIPKEEIVGTTAIIISVQYEKQEFFRCGYYVRNEYDETVLQPPKNVSIPHLRRHILAENPRIFRFEIQWAKREGKAYEDNELLQQNLRALGGDPFQQSNGALQELQKIEYSYGMFQNQMPL